MEDDQKKVSVRVMVTEKTSPDLFEYLNSFEPYYKGRQLLRLAMLGLSLDRGKITAALPAAADRVQPGPAQNHQSSVSDKPVYSIPMDVSESLDDLLNF